MKTSKHKTSLHSITAIYDNIQDLFVAYHIIAISIFMTRVGLFNKYIKNSKYRNHSRSSFNNYIASPHEPAIHYRKSRKYVLI